MIRLSDKADCCGCSACAAACPHGAISMVPDVLGFMYPSVDAVKCVECGLCEKVCAFNDGYDKSCNLEELVAYGARHKDVGELESSRSGAVFIAVSDYILEKGGVVYGAGYTDHFMVVHKRAQTRVERDEFRGSKYVQSHMGDCFVQVREDLKQGRTVLFTGTPCQTSGLRSYIGGNLRKNLYLMDIVCHGVPGPNIWRDYLLYLEKRKGARLNSVDFRSKKEFGWAAHRESYEYQGGERESLSGYTVLFYENVMLRPSCGKCHFANLVRPSDVTLADFWGWEKAAPGFNDDDKGASLVLVNTEKGLSMFEKVKDKLHVVEVKLDKCMQPNLMRPSALNVKSEAFADDYARRGFEYVYRKYGEDGFRYKFRMLKWRIKQWLRKIV